MNMDIREVITRPEYDFLRTNPHLDNNIMFLTFGGSHSYGTNTEGSDIDVRGCAFPHKKDSIGLSSFEKVVENETDTTIYEFNKMVGLMLNCNPNTIEMLGCRPETYIFYSDWGRELVTNRKMFLSKKAIYSFGGYANQQLRRLQNALARDSYTQSEKERHILGSCQSNLNKHAMHLVRLYHMCIDILEKEDIVTYRVEDHDELMAIRNGFYQKEDGTFRKEFFELIDDLKKSMEYAKENTMLPDKPDYVKIEEFVLEVNKSVVLGE